jgi:hypothetical protein
MYKDRAFFARGHIAEGHDRGQREAASIPCAIRNLSEAGTGLEMVTTVGIPTALRLTFDNTRGGFRGLQGEMTGRSVCFTTSKAKWNAGRSSPG